MKFFLRILVLFLCPIHLFSQSCSYNDCNSSECGQYDNISFEAINYLCERGVLKDSRNVNPEDLIIREDVAKIIFKGLYGSYNNPSDYNAAYFPTPYYDLQDHGSYHDYARVLCYLEYEDGISVFNRDFTYFNPSENIIRAYFVKALLEAWNISPDNAGSSPFDDIDEDREEWGYINRAYDLGVITGYRENGRFISGAYEKISREEAFIMLYRIMRKANVSKPSQSELRDINNYYVSYNFTPYTSLRALGVQDGSFPHYSKSTFNIPDIKFSLNFTHQYNSYVTQLPRSFYPIEPLSRGWSHNYNHYIVMEEDEILKASNYAIISPDGSMKIYRDFDYGSANDGFITLGIYDKFDRSGDFIYITSKDKVEFKFEKIDRNKNIFYLTQVKDRNGNRLRIAYESAEAKDTERIKYVKAPSGKKLYFFYHNGTDLLEKIEDPASRDIKFYYDSDNRLSKFYDAKDNRTKYYYNAGSKYYERNLLTEVRLPEGNSIKADYNKQRKLSRFWTNNDPPTSVSIEKYNKNSFKNFQAVAITTPMPNGDNMVTTVNINKNGLPSRISNNLGSVTNDFPTGGSHPTLPNASNLNGVIINYKYDNDGNVEKITKQHSEGDIIQEFYWNSDNDLYKYIDPRGNQTRFYYSDKGNLTKIKDPLGNQTNIDYNHYGQIAEVKNAENITTVFEYNSDGMLQESRLKNDSEDIVSTFSYDDINRIIRVNSNGLINQFSYDKNDNVYKQKDPLNQITLYGYDRNDNLTKLVNKRGYVTEFKYDELDRITDIDFEGLVKSYFYTEEGYLSTYTKPSRKKVKYKYTDKGLLRSTSTIDDINYNDRNLMESISNDYGNLGFRYDDINRLSKVKNLRTNNSVRYYYDEASNVVKINYPETGIDAKYDYDEKNRIIRLYAQDYKGKNKFLLASFEYLADDRLQRIDYANGYYTKYNYDDAGRLTKLRHYNSKGDIVARYNYTINARGNITQEEVKQPFKVTPNLKNGVTKYAYNANNHLLKIDGEDVSIDKDGRTKHKPNTDYTFNLDDRLTDINSLDFKAKYEYDALGLRRTAIRNDDKPVVYEWDVKGIGNILVEKQGDKEHYYFYGPNGLIARIDNNNNLHFYHGDVRGSVVIMSNPDGKITHEYGYDDFGNLAHIVEENENRFRYVGMYGVQYEHNDLQFMRARYYDSSIGRFLSEDPIWSQNLYTYAGNNPIGYNDYTGNEPNWCPVNSKSQGTVGQYNPTVSEQIKNWSKKTYQKNKWDIDAAITLISVVPTPVAVEKAIVSVSTKAVTNFEKLTAASLYGINTYKNLRSRLLVRSGFEVHHLIEQRFISLIGGNTKNWLSIVVTKSEHQLFTQRWRSLIGYNNMNSLIKTSTATYDDVINAAKKVYADYPEILKALGL